MWLEEGERFDICFWFFSETDVCENIVISTENTACAHQKNILYILYIVVIGIYHVPCNCNWNVYFCVALCAWDSSLIDFGERCVHLTLGRKNTLSKNVYTKVKNKKILTQGVSLYSPKSQVTHLLQRASQSVQNTTHFILSPSSWIR